ncbi:hypothetical protein E3_1880 [Rhodococcus phage E3]|uniref:hypothetical protein n=1 Tax=Rhodococcus phage E3 TaxID=1007869 RepID=UPI0002C69F6F|nr:hypothetical protein M176_gp199 [Rhodococcus phage E3]AEQ21107.1 hypothetical protein E3_1880 [Rhodococcus phage E3]
MIITTLLTLAFQAGILTLIVKTGRAQRRNREADQKAMAAAIATLTEQFDEKLLQVYMTDEERAKYGLPTIGGALPALAESATRRAIKPACKGPHAWSARYRDEPRFPANRQLADSDGKAHVRICIECEIHQVWDKAANDWASD